MMNKSNHSFHLVDISPWPLMASLGTLILTSGMVKWFYINSMSLLFTGLVVLSLTSYQWWRDISREGTFQGLHTYVVFSGLKMGMILFIISEVFFFLSFFWGFFHSSLAPTLELGLNWPPSGVTPFNAFQIPLLNTVILLSSGFTVTWAHHAILESNHNSAINSLLITVILGIYFTMLQAVEYLEATFSIADSVYGASFFMTTGFHGLHVIIGTSFLLVSLIRLLKCQLSETHHFGFEASAWYWHFVDVVWLFLFMNIYWWGA